MIKLLYIYLKHRSEINNHYGYALKNGYATDDELGWKGRTAYWLRCE